MKPNAESVSATKKTIVKFEIMYKTVVLVDVDALFYRQLCAQKNTCKTIEPMGAKNNSSRSMASMRFHFCGF